MDKNRGKSVANSAIAAKIKEIEEQTKLQLSRGLLSFAHNNNANLDESDDDIELMSSAQVQSTPEHSSGVSSVIDGTSALPNKVNKQDAQYFMSALKYVCKKTSLAGVKFLLTTVMYPHSLLIFEQINTALCMLGIDEIDIMWEYNDLAKNLKDAVMSKELTRECLEPNAHKLLDVCDIVMRVMASVLGANYLIQTLELVNKCQCEFKFAGLVIKALQNGALDIKDSLLRIESVKCCTACQNYEMILKKSLVEENSTIREFDMERRLITSRSYLLLNLSEWKRNSAERLTQPLSFIRILTELLTNEIMIMSNSKFSSLTDIHRRYDEKLRKRHPGIAIPQLDMLNVIDSLDWDTLENPEDLPMESGERNTLRTLISFIILQKTRGDERYDLDITINDPYSSSSDENTVSENLQRRAKMFTSIPYNSSRMIRVGFGLWKL